MSRTIKRRILNRSQVLHVLHINQNWQSYTEDEQRYAHMYEKQASIDILAYMLADGSNVKVYNDRNMGGMVVEYDVD